jgi:hypothetical protein
MAVTKAPTQTTARGGNSITSRATNEGRLNLPGICAGSRP